MCGATTLPAPREGRKAHRRMSIIDLNQASPVGAMTTPTTSAKMQMAGTSPAMTAES